MKNLFVMAVFALFLASCGTCTEETCTDEVVTETAAVAVEADSVDVSGEATVEVEATEETTTE